MHNNNSGGQKDYFDGFSIIYERCCIHHTIKTSELQDTIYNECNKTGRDKNHYLGNEIVSLKL